MQSHELVICPSQTTRPMKNATLRKTTPKLPEKNEICLVVDKSVQQEFYFVFRIK